MKDIFECIYCGTNTPNEHIGCDTCEKTYMQNTINTITPNLQSSYAEDRYFNGDIFNPDPNRIVSVPGTMKTITDEESSLDSLDYFITNKLDLEKDFEERLEKEIGQDKTQEFLSLISEYWYPKGKRDSKAISDLKCTIQDYFNHINKTPFVNNTCTTNPNNSLQLNFNDIEKIIKINKEMIHHYLSMWIETDWDKSTNFIYFRRGLNTDTLPTLYRENDYISSYTLAISVSEQFSSMGNSDKYIVSGEYGLFFDRILFFTPFIKNIPATQLEIGVLPATHELKLIQEDITGDTIELILSD